MPRTTTIQVTDNYNDFVFLGANRNLDSTHVNAIKKSFEEHGNFTAQQPILVNENMAIIDGQHRFQALKELELPVYYAVHPGLTVDDAISMNILHKNWTSWDYAHSYAETGNTNYVKFLQIAEDFDYIAISTLIAYIVGYKTEGMFADFRNGELKVTDVPAARHRLDMLSEALENTNIKDKAFTLAYLRLLNHPDFKQERMVRKLQAASHLLRHYGGETEYIRALEDVYNYGYAENNRTRFF